MKNFTIPEIRVFLAENLPYWESDDKDEFMYIAKASDIEKLSEVLYRKFHNCEEPAIAPVAELPCCCMDEEDCCPCCEARRNKR
jgi:hypothetical protein